MALHSKMCRYGKKDNATLPWQTSLQSARTTHPLSLMPGAKQLACVEGSEVLNQ
jgi:hypothetical protein